LHKRLVTKFETTVEAGQYGTRYKPPAPQLKILDVCSGSGCISLLLYSLLSNSKKFPDLNILGLDISEDAVSLANENLRRNAKDGRLSTAAINSYENMKSHANEEHLFISAINGLESPRKQRKKRQPKWAVKGGLSSKVQFMLHDVFNGLPRRIGRFDIIISNPPYISQKAFETETTRSVRNWEPKLALVPSSKPPWNTLNKSDVFYHQLLDLHDWHRSKVLLMEIGDAAQAVRVVKMALQKSHLANINRFEIWRDWPEQEAQPEEVQSIEIDGRQIPVKGAGKMRAVALFRTDKF
jgi:methylase of polypeptide subunit release factors